MPADTDGPTPLVLTGEVVVEDADGLRLETQELELHRLATRVVSKGPVSLVSPPVEPVEPVEPPDAPPLPPPQPARLLIAASAVRMWYQVLS